MKCYKTTVNEFFNFYNLVNSCTITHLKLCVLFPIRAIRDYNERTGFVVGFKPAGGIRTAKDACTWLILIKEELGNKWLCNKLFRIGASSLLGDIERQLYHYTTGRYAAAHEFAMA